jgi:heme-degrading monooxygenase HmoA
VIQHIVLLKLKPETTDRQVIDAFEAGESLANEIPGLIEFQFGRNRAEPEHGFGVASIVRFEDEDALHHYLEHPARLRYIEEHVAPLTEQRIELDVPVEAAHRPADKSASAWYWGGSARMLDDAVAGD